MSKLMLFSGMVACCLAMPVVILAADKPPKKGASVKEVKAMSVQEQSVAERRPCRKTRLSARLTTVTSFFGGLDTP